MPRLLVIIPLVTWLLADGTDDAVGGGLGAWGVALTWIGCGAIPLVPIAVVVARAWGNRPSTPRTRTVRTGALVGMLVWFALACHVFGWPEAVRRAVGSTGNTVGIVLGTLPAYLGWALHFATPWPVVRRRQQAQPWPDDGRRLPGFWRWWLEELRPTLLVTLAPLMVFWIIKDLAMLGVRGGEPWTGIAADGEAAALLLTGVALAAAVTVGPPIIRRVLPTRAIPDQPGPAGRLHELVRQSGLHHHRGMLRAWHTGNRVVNALAVGLVPRMRYVLLSDLLLDALAPWQVEAVLGHELGHLRHRHVLWFVLFFISAALVVLGPVGMAYDWLVPAADAWPVRALDTFVSIALLLAILLGFVRLSRLFERQADVFAARLVAPGEGVTPDGAWAFGEALQAATGINGDAEVNEGPGLIPRVRGTLRRQVHALHGTPESRARYLVWLSHDPGRARGFDRQVAAIKLAIVAAAVISVGVVLAA